MACIGYDGYHNQKTFSVQQFLPGFPRLTGFRGISPSEVGDCGSKHDALTGIGRIRDCREAKTFGKLLMATEPCQAAALQNGRAGANTHAQLVHDGQPALNAIENAGID